MRDNASTLRASLTAAPASAATLSATPLLALFAFCDHEDDGDSYQYHPRHQDRN